MLRMMQLLYCSASKCKNEQRKTEINSTKNTINVRPSITGDLEYTCKLHAFFVNHCFFTYLWWNSHHCRLNRSPAKRDKSRIETK